MDLKHLAGLVVLNNAAYTGQPGEPTLVEIMVESAEEQGTPVTEAEATELIDAAMLDISTRL